MFILVWVALAVLGNHLMIYSVETAFGSSAGWTDLSAWVRYPVVALFAYPVMVIAIVVWVASLFMGVPLF